MCVHAPPTLFCMSCKQTLGGSTQACLSFLSPFFCGEEQRVEGKSWDVSRPLRTLFASCVRSDSCNTTDGKTFALVLV